MDEFWRAAPHTASHLYSGKRGGGKLSKWVFYIFYPLHLIILTYIRVKTR
ncbi:MAG: hypothetical protein II762_09540 [Ruminococcus sp.]|nr:hypothetical protein [Ruminococcus sp.]